MHRMSYVVALSVVQCGCSSSKLGFVPTEKINSSNVDRLTLVSCAKYEDESLLDRLSEGVNAIGPVAVDGSTRQLFVHRKVRIGPHWSMPVTVDTYSLTTGKKLRATRIPGQWDMSGSDTRSDRAWIDASRHTAYVQRRWKDDYVFRLDLEKDAPRLVNQVVPTRLPSSPLADEARVLLVTQDLQQGLLDNGAAFVDRSSGQTLSSYPWDAPSRMDNRFYPQIIGAIGSTVLAWIDRGPGGIELQAMENGAERLLPLHVTTIPYPWSLGVTELDLERRQLLAVVYDPISSESTQAKLCIYDIPSLRLAKEIPLEGNLFSLAASGDVLLLSYGDVSDSVTILNRETGQVIKTLNLNACWNDDRTGSWWVFADPHGLFAGVYGCYWVQLFAIK